MTTGIDNPDIEGTLEDLKLTDKQKELFNVIAYYSKISMAIENSEGQIYIEKPNGFQEFIKKVEEARKENNNDDIPLDEYEDLESKYRYDKLRRPLGNSTSIINMLLRHLSTNKEFDEMIKESQAEAIEIAKKISSFAKIPSTRKGL